MDLSDAYENGAYIQGAAQYPPRWAAAAAAYRAGLGPRAVQGMPYGPGARHRLDLFLPEHVPWHAQASDPDMAQLGGAQVAPQGLPKGLVVFIHGGYWRQFDRADWSHFAEGARARGWAVAMPSYDLCPDVRIAQITGQIVSAIVTAAARVPGPIVICGHSAGGHLTARMAHSLPPAVMARLRHLMPISPLSDLAPLMQTAMNADLRLDAAEARAESPVNAPAPAVPVTVWVGGAERPAFLEQARWLGEAWGCAVVVDEGRHHFDVIDGLADPRSGMVDRLLGA